MHQAFLHRFLTWTLWDCRIPHHEESLDTVSFKDIEGKRLESPRKHVVPDGGNLLQTTEEPKSSSLMFHAIATIRPYCSRGLRARHMQEEGVKI